jgi:hypothetical protein
VHLLDRDPVQQQEALGVLGVNLLHAAFFGREDLSRALESLLGRGMRRAAPEGVPTHDTPRAC